MIRKWHKRGRLAAFYLPSKLFAKLGWREGETLEVEIDGRSAYIKKTDKAFTTVQTLQNRQKMVTIPVEAESKSLKDSSSVDFKIVDNILIVKFL